MLRKGSGVGVRHHSSDWSGDAQPVAEAASRAADAKRSRTSATRSGVSGDRMGRVGGSAVENRDVEEEDECVEECVIVCGVGMVKAEEEAVRDKMARA